MQLFNMNCSNIKVTLTDSGLDDDDYFFEIIIKKNKLKDFLIKLLLLQDTSEPAIEIPLTKREKQVLKLLASGKNNAQIAEKMHVSVHTTKVHIHNIFSKLSVQDRTEAVVKAIKYKIIDV